MLVSPGAATDHGVTLFFLKTVKTFLVIVLWKLMTFSTYRLVTTTTLSPSNVICTVLFVNSAAKKLISFGCHSLDGVIRAVRLPAP